MADFGRLYSGFDADFPREMARLCQGADIILPNITEACLLLGMEYREEYDREYIRSLLHGLAQLGASVCAITGVSFEEDKLGVVSYDSASGEYFSYFRERCPGVFHGTGDLFASTVAGAVLNNWSIPDALALAADYTLECIKYTISDENANWYGVNFEQAIPYLIHRLYLPAAQCCLNGLVDKGEVRLQRARLLCRVILPERYEVHILAVEEPADVLRRTGQTVVCRKGYHKRSAVSQVRLCRHSDGGVGHAVCKLCKSIPRARRNDHRLHRFARAERFRLGYGGHNVPPGYLHQALDVLRGRAEAAVRLRCVFAHYRDKLIFFREPFCLLEHPAVCTI